MRVFKRIARIKLPKKPVQHEWQRSETLALAQQSCTWCFGTGLRPGRAGKTAPCNCVFRAIFRACYQKFRTIVEGGVYYSKSSLTATHHPGRTRTWGFRNQEFAADFYLVSKRHLNEQEHTLFRLHYLLGADWRACCGKLGMDRGRFFQECYRIEQILGRVFRELKPHALFPVDEYMASSSGARIKSAAELVKRVPHPDDVDETDDDDGDGSDCLANYIGEVEEQEHWRAFPLRAVANGD